MKFSVLRVGPDIDVENIDSNREYFLFTKSLGVRFINIFVKEDELGKAYAFNEKPNTRLEVRYPCIDALCAQNFGMTYWNASLTPIFDNGVLKYCIEITTDITEKVLNKKR